MHISIDLALLLIIFPLICTVTQHAGQWTRAAPAAAAGGSFTRENAMIHTNQCHWNTHAKEYRNDNTNINAELHENRAHRYHAGAWINTHVCILFTLCIIKHTYLQITTTCMYYVTRSLVLHTWSVFLIWPFQKKYSSTSLPGWTMETEGWASLTFAMRRRRVSLCAHMCVVHVW